MKFKLTDETILHNGIILHRIECIKAFDDIEIGDKGGWVESMDNLSQDGNAWIYGEAEVYGGAYVYDNAKISGSAIISDGAIISGNAIVNDNAEVGENATVGGHAVICDHAFVFGNAIVNDDAIVYGNTEVFDGGQIYGKASVGGNVIICGNAIIKDTAKVCGFVQISGNTIIVGDANVESNEDYMVFKNTWSSGRYFTWTRSNDKWKVGCFYGTGEELIKKAYVDSKLIGDCYKATVEYVENIHKLIENESK